MDRVIEHFVGTNEDSLRVYFEAHAEGRGMSTRLREEVSSHQLCQVDDTWVEAVHRDVSATCKRASACTFPWVAATLRLSQNLAVMDSAGANGKDHRSLLFSKWRVICQHSAAKAIKLILVRNGSRAKLISEAYRMRFEPLHDWAASLQDALKPMEQLQVKQRLHRNARLKVDYLSHVLSDNHIYSIPMGDDIGRSADAGTLQEAVQRMDDAAFGFRFFQIVDCNVRRKKLVPTQASQEYKVMAFP